jgi:hypothetical protein
MTASMCAVPAFLPAGIANSRLSGSQMVADHEDGDTIKGDPREHATTPNRKDCPMDVDLHQLLPFRRTSQQTESQTDLITCSLCLRVLRGREWMDAERVIREIRSYELEAPPRLRSAVCDVCAESIFSHRTEDQPVAA